MPLPHLLANLILCLGALAGGAVLWRRGKKAATAGLIAAAVLGALAWVVWWRPDLFVRAVPVSGAIFYSNLFLYAAALGGPCALAFAKSRGHAVRIGVLAGVMVLLPWWEVRWFWQPPARSATTLVDADGIVRQTSTDTCSAAAGATLLGLHGVEATEADVAALALTKERRGTRSLGLYRGLKIAVDGDPLRVRYRRISGGDLLGQGLPAITAVGLPKRGLTAEQRAFADTYSWEPGVWHDVLVKGPDPERAGRVLVADPDFGLESWPREHFDALYQGFAIWLEPK
ncbi:MAG: hypothetical protein RLY93_18345 [Sumerlaeia bacterium]